MAEIISISFESELKTMADTLNLFTGPKQAFIIQNTLNNAAFDALRDLRAKTPSYIDRPTPFTINSSRVTKATRDRLSATIDFKDSGRAQGGNPSDYLKPIVNTGGRRHKRFESALIAAGLMPRGYFAIPTRGAPRDNYGNVPRALFRAIIDGVGATPELTKGRRIAKLKKQGTGKFLKGFIKGIQNKDKIAKREARAKTKATKYFVSVFGANGSTLPSGIYERQTTKGGKQNSSLKRLFNLVPAVSYRKTFPFYDIVSKQSSLSFSPAFGKAVENEIKGIVKRYERIGSR